MTKYQILLRSPSGDWVDPYEPGFTTMTMATIKALAWYPGVEFKIEPKKGTTND